MTFIHKASGVDFDLQISLDLNSSDKFCSLLRTALMVFSQILEVTSLQEVGKHADELLAYMKSTVLIEATGTVLCVQQVCDWVPKQGTLLAFASKNGESLKY